MIATGTSMRIFRDARAAQTIGNSFAGCVNPVGTSSGMTDGANGGVPAIALASPGQAQPCQGQTIVYKFRTIPRIDVCRPREYSPKPMEMSRRVRPPVRSHGPVRAVLRWAVRLLWPAHRFGFGFILGKRASRGSMTGTIVASGTNTFNFTGTIVTDVVATAGTYHIAVFGAQGGTGYSTHPGGLGADIEGDVVLTQGETIEIVVGGAGTSGTSSSAGGGGGGSFVLAINNGTIVPLVIAGGGGGGSEPKYCRQRLGVGDDGCVPRGSVWVVGGRRRGDQWERRGGCNFLFLGRRGPSWRWHWSSPRT